MCIWTLFKIDTISCSCLKEYWGYVARLSLVILLCIYLQLCMMARDMDMETRIAAFNALGKILTVSEDILLQTLSKKALAETKEKNYPGQYTAKVFKIPATAAAFTFVHGLEDEFYQVNLVVLIISYACHFFKLHFEVQF